jgi:hypothetical protein
MDKQLNELSKGYKANDNPNRYNLRSKKKGGNLDVPKQPTRVEKPANDIASNNKERKAQSPPTSSQRSHPRGKRNYEAPVLF